MGKTETISWLWMLPFVLTFNLALPDAMPHRFLYSCLLGFTLRNAVNFTVWFFGSRKDITMEQRLAFRNVRRLERLRRG
jgi:hypothetical protein